MLSVACEKVGIRRERPPSSATERLVGKTDLLHEVGPQGKSGQWLVSLIENTLWGASFLSNIITFHPSSTT